MTDPFEYDVFISFSSADEEIVKPIWQELCSNGLRVFWSDSSLKKEAGNSWFEVIEKALERSRHMLLICSVNAISSKWVQREYRAFFDYCYSPNSRRLIPILTREFSSNDLPLFLRQLQVGKINDPQFIQEIIPILGGVNIEKLKYELQSLNEKLSLLSIENHSLNERSRMDAKKVKLLTRENTAARERIDKLSSENASLRNQITELNDETNFPKEKLRNQKKSSSFDTMSQAHSSSIPQQFTEEFLRLNPSNKIRHWGEKVYQCPNCAKLNHLSDSSSCMVCKTKLTKSDVIANPFL